MCAHAHKRAVSRMRLSTPWACVQTGFRWDLSFSDCSNRTEISHWTPVRTHVHGGLSRVQWEVSFVCKRIKGQSITNHWMMPPTGFWQPCRSNADSVQGRSHSVIVCMVIQGCQYHRSPVGALSDCVCQYGAIKDKSPVGGLWCENIERAGILINKLH